MLVVSFTLYIKLYFPLTVTFLWTVTSVQSSLTDKNNLALMESDLLTSLSLIWRRQEWTRTGPTPWAHVEQEEASRSLKEKVKLLVNNGFAIVEEGCNLLGGCLGSFCRSHFWKLLGIRKGKLCPVCVASAFRRLIDFISLRCPDLSFSVWEAEPLSLDSAPA